MVVKIWKELLIMVAIFTATWVVFSLRHYSVEENPFSISSENEKKLADFIGDHMMGFQEIENDTLKDSLLLILDRLIVNMDTVSYNYQLHVVNQPEINAFTTLNGNIYIFSGLIEKLDCAEELAVILAHEIGHAEHQHVVEKIIKTVGIEAIFSILAGGDPVLLSEVAKLAVSNSFDRVNESEADDFALKLSYRSGINPRRLGQFFLRLKAEEKSVLDGIEFLRTHPLDNDRIKKSSDFQIPEDFQEDPIKLDWINIKKLTKNG